MTIRRRGYAYQAYLDALTRDTTTRIGRIGKCLGYLLTPLTALPRPRSGWLKAIRGALGLTTRQLGARVGATHQVIVRQEERETRGAVTLESLDRTARAMGCRLVYAIVPDSQYGSLEAILDESARVLARKLGKDVTHSMKLESQGVDAGDTEAQIERLAQDLKAKLDPRLWEK